MTDFYVHLFVSAVDSPTYLPMARLSLALYLLVLGLPAYLPSLLSQDLIAILQRHAYAEIAVSRLLERVTHHEVTIDETVGALESASTGTQRAQAACYIVSTVFPGKVLADDDPDYEDEFQFNW